jgi:hypothetical protein
MANQNVRFPDGQAGFPVGRKDRRKVKSVCVRFDGLVRAAESNVKEPVTEFPLSLCHVNVTSAFAMGGANAEKPDTKVRMSIALALRIRSARLVRAAAVLRKAR